MNYYNENEPYCVAWLKNLIEARLIPAGHVDDRDIRLVQPADLAGYHQCHFFAGIAGWSLALGLAGWTEPCWTGSCPCQPFSVAGKRLGFVDERHLWPEWFRLIRQCRPAIVFGEQVARATVWLDAVFADLESEGYACGAAVLPAASVGAPHRRERFWFVVDANEHSWYERRPSNALEGPKGWHVDRGSVSARDVADADSPRFSNYQRFSANAGRDGNGTVVSGSRASRASNFWRVEPDVGRVAHGISARVVKLRALGNAIVPQVAAEFVAACMEAGQRG